MLNGLPPSLELSKVLQYLASFAVSEAGQQACLSLTPYESSSLRKQLALYQDGLVWLEYTSTVITAFPALDGLLSSLSSPAHVLDLDDLWALRQVLKLGETVMQSMTEGVEATLWSSWHIRCGAKQKPVKSLSAFMRCLSDDGAIKDAASPELALVRAEIRRLHQHCIRKVKDFAAEYNIAHFLQEEFMTLASDRYVLPLKVQYKNRLQGIIHDYSQTGETCYFEPLFLVELNNRLQELKREEREEEFKVLQYLTSLVRNEFLGIQSLYELLVDVDVLQARRALAACYDGVVVHFDSENIFLEEARHPLLALGSSARAVENFSGWLRHRAAREGSATEDFAVKLGAKAIPATLELLPGQRALIVSGGNAGGKTVALKTLGLITLMSMCALPVPVAAGSSLPRLKTVHAFIGDEQSLDDHVSTFTAQITHLSGIWSGLDSGSLVILDEFGVGTDPSQGAALAQAVIEGIIEKKAYVIAATHFPALKAFALSTEGVRAASVLFDPRTKKPLFRLAYDQVGASQALDVAREHGLPEEILHKAEHILLLGGEDTSALVDKLNTVAVAKEKEMAALRSERIRYEERRKQLAIRFDKEKQLLFDQLQAESQEILSAWKQGKSSHKQALKELARVRNSLIASNTEEQTTDSQILSVDSLFVGQQVVHTPWNKRAVIMEIDKRKQRIKLDLEGVALWAELKVISVPSELLSGKNNVEHAQVAQKNASGGLIISTESVPLHLDLRGMRADHAISEMCSFLDRAVLAGRFQVDIIHGRGTGVLRRELHKILQSFPVVAAFALANEDQGGDGVTHVELK